MMVFTQILGHTPNHPQAMETLLSMYRPLLIKEAVVNGTFDEDLYQELCIVFLRCVRNFWA